MKKTVAALTLFFAATTLAWADEEGGQVGAMQRRSDNDKTAATALVRSSERIYGLLAGSLSGKEVVVETQYVGAEKYEFAPAAGKPAAFGLTAMGILPVFSGVSLYGKLGLANTGALSPASAPSLVGLRRATATYGLGAQYKVSPNIGLHLGWNQYGSSITAGGGLRQTYVSNNWSCGAVFKF